MPRTNNTISIIGIIMALSIACTTGTKSHSQVHGTYSSQSLALNSSWKIVIGEKPDTVEKTAARDLQHLLKESANLELQIITPSEFEGEQGIIIGTGKSNSLIASSSRNGSLIVSEHEPAKEGFHLKTQDGNIYVAGFDSDGVLYGVYHLEDAIGGWYPDDALGQYLGSLDMLRVPFFKERWGDHVSQMPPLDYTDEQLARWYSRHYLSHHGRWSVYTKRRRTAPDILKKYGISEVGWEIVQAASQSWLAEHPEAASLGGFHNPLIVCFRTKIGKQKYAEWLLQNIADSPGVDRWMFIFSDANYICGSPCPRCGKDPFSERVLEIMTYMSEVARSVNPEIKVIANMWGISPEELRDVYKAHPEGIGFIQKEPHHLDINLLVRELTPPWHPLFDKIKPYKEVYLTGGNELGDDFYTITGIGDTGEVTCPVVGMQLPYVVAYKMQRLAKHNIRNFDVWWGGIHPWVYCVNHEVMREMIFDPFQDADILINRIAERDFGPEARQQVIRTWKAIDLAVNSCAYNEPVELPTPFQHFCKQMAKPFFYPLRPDMALVDPYLTPRTSIDIARKTELSLAMAIGRLQTAVEEAEKVVHLTEGEARRRAMDQLVWLKLFTNIFKTQNNLYVRVQILDDDLRKHSVQRGTSEYKEAFTPLIKTEIANAMAAKEIFKQIPFSNFQASAYIEKANTIDERSRQRDIERIDRKIRLMRDYLDGLPAPYIKDWLLLGPFSYQTGAKGATVLDKDFLGGEAEVRPKAGQLMGKLSWRPMHSSGFEINLNEWFKTRERDMTSMFAMIKEDNKNTIVPLSNQVAYACTNIITESKIENAKMYISSDDQVKMWLNGELVYTFEGNRWWDRDRDVTENLSIPSRGTAGGIATAMLWMD